MLCTSPARWAWGGLMGLAKSDNESEWISVPLSLRGPGWRWVLPGAERHLDAGALGVAAAPIAALEVAQRLCAA